MKERIEISKIGSTLIAIVLAACGEPSTPLPCEVDQVLEDKCRICHGAEVEFGAPMSLVDWEDTQAGAPTTDQRVWEEVRDRVRDTGDPMPPRGLPALTADERAILEAWFAAGAPPGDDAQACE